MHVAHHNQDRDGLHSIPFQRYYYCTSYRLPYLLIFLQCTTITISNKLTCTTYIHTTHHCGVLWSDNTGSPFTVLVTVTDDDGGVGQASVVVTVFGPLTITSLDVTSVIFGDTTTLSATFTGGNPTTLTAPIDWGDSGVVVLVSTESQNSDSSYSLAHTVSSGTDVLVVSICTESGVAVTSINWNTSESLTIVQQDTFDGVTRSVIATLVNPTSGLSNVDIELAEAKKTVTGAMNFAGIDTSAHIDANTGENAEETNPSIQITTNSPNAMIVDSLCREGAGITSTDLENYNLENTIRGASQRELATTSGVHDQDYTDGESKKYALSVIALKDDPNSSITPGIVDQVLRTVSGSHEYGSVGSYEVSLTVDDGTESDVEVAQITVVLNILGDPITSPSNNERVKHGNTLLFLAEYFDFNENPIPNLIVKVFIDEIGDGFPPFEAVRANSSECSDTAGPSSSNNIAAYDQVAGSYSFQICTSALNSSGGQGLQHDIISAVVLQPDDDFDDAFHTASNSIRVRG